MAPRNAVSRRATAETRGTRAAQAIRPVSLSEQLRKMLRHPKVLLACIAVCALVGGLMSLATSAKYEATSTVVVYPLTTDPNAVASNQLLVNIDTEASVAHSREVAQKAAEKIEGSNEGRVNQLLSNVEVAAHTGTSILDFTATSDDPALSAQFANAMAESYLEVRQESLKATVDQKTAEIRDRLDALDSNSDAARSSLQERLTQVEVTSTEGGRVVTQAQDSGAASSLSFLQYLLVGALIGAMLGAILSWIVDTRLPDVRYLDRAQEAVGADLHELREGKEIEDTRRILRTLGAPAGQFAAAGLAGAVVYSLTQEAGKRFANYLFKAAEDSDVFFTDSLESAAQAQEQGDSSQATVLVPAADIEVSQVLDAADQLGSCLVVVTPESELAALNDFISAAEMAVDARIEYVYLNK
ncbi:MAG: hypothetical protein Q4C74_05870 [Rothia sp. (in: high G+C Gram-positive bacteria)]|nr:hypothetical protein [Rothia sp. (in: high G+C Gram-positive bacteria)]